MERTEVNIIGDILGAHKSAEIKNLLRGNVVRRLTKIGNTIFLFPMEGPILQLDPSTPLSYEPWDCDRGNILFQHASIPGTPLKLCTELDLVVSPDGTEASVVPGSEINPNNDGPAAAGF